MIIHKLIRHYCSHGADSEFYRIQAIDATKWMRRKGIKFEGPFSVIDLGCGHGVFGEELKAIGCHVTFVDMNNTLSERLDTNPFVRRDIDREGLNGLGTYDLVICSNVFEHLSRPKSFIEHVHELINPGGHLYLSWTNWLSPWGGHDFSPFHFFGPRLGPWLWDKVVRRPRMLHPFGNLFPVHIGKTLKWVTSNGHLRVEGIAPRYYTELDILLKIPVLREFTAWNCVILAKRV